MKIAVLLLCHESARQVAKRLSATFFRHPDIKVFVHYDAKRSDSQLEALRSLLPADLNYALLSDRVRCHWGEYSLVDATHRLIKASLGDMEFGADRLILVSGSCVPYRPVSSLQEFLRRNQTLEFIEAKDISRGRWVKDGLESERFQFYFPFNFITQKKLFESFTDLQRQLGINRSKPEGLQIHFGSQWFCITRATAAKVASRLSEPELKRFFKHSWIPDEFAFQTLVAAAVKPSQIAGHSLTYYEFDEQGRPLVLENGHMEHLLMQPFFFARKVAPEAAELLGRIDDYTSRDEEHTRYFDHVGSATVDYQKYVILASTIKSKRARVGSTKDMWRGPMDSSRRNYYVLHSSSRQWLLDLIRKARGQTGSGLPLFDLPFDDPDIEIAGGRVSYLGFSPEDRFRRDHDPAAYLYEMVNCDAVQPAAFGLDMRREGWTRDFVRWDVNATVVNCDPPLTREQRAATALDELLYARDRNIVRETLVSMSNGAAIPDEYVDKMRSAHEHSCQAVNLRDLGWDLGDATLLSLRQAFDLSDQRDYFPTAELAWRRFWK